MFLLAGLIAGGASLAAVILLKDFFKVPQEWAGTLPDNDRGVAELAAAEAVMANKNLFLTIGVLGAVVGGLMGVAGGVRDRSFPRGAAGLLLGLVLGGGFGVASAYLGPEVVGERIDAGIAPTTPFETLQYTQMFRTLAVHATMWGLIGVAAAVAGTWPTRRTAPLLKSAVGALVAATLAMMAYQALLGNVFQVSRFELLLPQDMGPIAVWTLPPSVLIAVAIGRLSVPEQPTAA